MNSRHQQISSVDSTKNLIWWVRRDLRLSDNQAILNALATGCPIIPVFIFDPRLVASPYMSEKRLAFLLGGLRALRADLESRGSTLVFRQGKPGTILPGLLFETSAQAILAEPDYSPFALQRDLSLESRLPIHWVGSPTVWPPGTVLKNDGQPYTVFTPFSKAWKALPGLPGQETFVSPSHIPTPVGITSEPIPDRPALPGSAPFIPGESAARQLLQRFTTAGAAGLSPIYTYTDQRNRLDLDGTSRLSPYLHFGMISARQAVAAALQAIQAAPDAQGRKGAETWLNELIWREFYIHILAHFPHVRRKNFRHPGVRWLNQPEHFEAWTQGRTGYPVVDAAMRQLVQSGWMHNRARMIVASFLTKDLLIDWRWGERFFMQHLIDGETASNNGGWQWTAGTGTDAAPYFRIFNPVSQGQRHDPHGAYIRRWLPELRAVPTEFVHAPWMMPTEIQDAFGFHLGEDYPFPIVDHAEARERTLQAYRVKGD